MTYQEYLDKYENVDHLLIRMTDEFPYFCEKRIIRNGQEHIETNYHIADGMFSTYINYEVDCGLSARIDKTITFEGICDYPVFVTNVSDNKIELRIDDSTGILEPGEVLAIRPDELKQETVNKFDVEMIKCFEEGKGLRQSEINDLLGNKT